MVAAMTWIRSPLWDGFWILSGLPIGLALATQMVPIPVLLTLFIALNSSHLLAPVVMAWSHDGFRQIMLARKVRYILIPTGIIVLGGVFGNYRVDVP